jgi:hypothetical protein
MYEDEPTLTFQECSGSAGTSPGVLTPTSETGTSYQGHTLTLGSSKYTIPIEASYSVSASKRRRVEDAYHPGDNGPETHPVPR